MLPPFGEYSLLSRPNIQRALAQCGQHLAVNVNKLCPPLVNNEQWVTGWFNAVKLHLTGTLEAHAASQTPYMEDLAKVIISIIQYVIDWMILYDKWDLPFDFKLIPCVFVNQLTLHIGHFFIQKPNSPLTRAKLISSSQHSMDLEKWDYSIPLPSNWTMKRTLLQLRARQSITLKAADLNNIDQPEWKLRRMVQHLYFAPTSELAMVAEFEWVNGRGSTVCARGGKTCTVCIAGGTQGHLINKTQPQDTIDSLIKQHWFTGRSDLPGNLPAENWNAPNYEGLINVKGTKQLSRTKVFRNMPTVPF
ncbi:hypothetical protein DACRYDRAFT_16599 [Dacryopinax primogenitus]|uniref:Uncharacterized protein n=1 Tax=Dacryopinax primogenitus (strain DJM 731) TaxID=1858805 RepID=M5G450_DACPD|nr:uncharacterized protein DACRYDRAFT_16599 [Dacryopinax primogenitus]EJU00612.1 hypothetical protein DACRYDRAFT_16599 [Dacryopinax primogenitus]